MKSIAFDISYHNFFPLLKNWSRDIKAALWSLHLQNASFNLVFLMNQNLGVCFALHGMIELHL